jgi:tryptophan-rich sensory protein
MTDDGFARPLPRPLAALLALAPVVLAAALGNAATTPNLAGWYANLIKPALNPPNWVFGPIWTALYLLIACAFYRILRSKPSNARRRAISVFLFQMALNCAWSFAFFAAHNPMLGLAVIVAMEAAIVAAIVLFHPIDKTAARLLWPYAAWVAFAAYLNAAIWGLN